MRRIRNKTSINERPKIHPSQWQYTRGKRAEGDPRSQRFGDFKSIKRNHARKKMVKLFAVSAFGSLIIFFSLIRQVDINIHSDTINEDEKLALANVYGEWTHGYISEDFLKKSVFFLDQRELKKQLQDAHPSVREIKTQNLWWEGTMRINVIMRSPYAVLTSNNDTQYIIDSEGVAYQLAQDADDLNSPSIKIFDEVGSEVTLGNQVVGSSTIEYIAEIADYAKQQGVIIEKYIIPSSFREVYFKPESSSYLVKTHLDINPQETIHKYQETKQFVEKKGIIIKEYIDLRVMDKSIYR